QLDGGVNCFSPLQVRHTEYDAIVDCWMLAQNTLDIGRVNVEAARDDDVAQAILQEQISLFVQIAAIASAQPPIAKGFCRFVRLSPVPRHNQIAPDDHLAYLSGR